MCSLFLESFTCFFLGSQVTIAYDVMLERARKIYCELEDWHRVDYNKNQKQLARSLVEFSVCLGWIQGRTISHLGKVITSNVVDNSPDERIEWMTRHGKGWQAVLVQPGGLKRRIGLARVDLSTKQKFVEENPEHEYSTTDWLQNTQPLQPPKLEPQQLERTQRASTFTTEEDEFIKLKFSLYSGGPNVWKTIFELGVKENVWCSEKALSAKQISRRARTLRLC